MLDPRDWKQEHQTALIGAIALGAFVCFVFAFMHTKAPYWSDWSIGRGFLESSHERWYYISNLDFSFLPWRGVSYLLSLTLWTAFGGVVGGSVVCIAQLLRR
jgi:hypothetical protein